MNTYIYLPRKREISTRHSRSRSKILGGPQAELDGEDVESLSPDRLRAALDAVAPPGDREDLANVWHKDWGDRRQELVFIGANMDELSIRAMLDSCLLSDAELEDYREATRYVVAVSGTPF